MSNDLNRKLAEAYMTMVDGSAYEVEVLNEGLCKKCKATQISPKEKYCSSCAKSLGKAAPKGDKNVRSKIDKALKGVKNKGLKEAKPMSTIQQRIYEERAGLVEVRDETDPPEPMNFSAHPEKGKTYVAIDVPHQGVDFYDVSASTKLSHFQSVPGLRDWIKKSRVKASFIFIVKDD